MPFPPSDFPLDGFQDDIAKRAFLLARVPAQLVMQLLWYVFDLNIRHAGTLACPEHAGNLERIDSTLACYAAPYGRNNKTGRRKFERELNG
jgi:hypothetical protein